MRIKTLAQGENILMLGFEPSTFVSKIDILTTTDYFHVSIVDMIHVGNNTESQLDELLS